MNIPEEAVSPENQRRDAVDIQPELVDNVHVSAFLSLFELTTKPGDAARRLRPGRNPSRQSREKADTLRLPIASHSD